MKNKLRRDLIHVKIQEIREGIHLVSVHLPDSYEKFSQLGLVKDGIYKRTEDVIETVLDICAILNSDLKLGIPGEDEDSITHLIQGGILSHDMAEKIRGMKTFQKIVMHRYGAIDDRIAYTLLVERIGDFELFCRGIEHYLARD